jgi:hypothetical protein
VSEVVAIIMRSSHRAGQAPTMLARCDNCRRTYQTTAWPSRIARYTHCHVCVPARARERDGRWRKEAAE